MKSLLQNCICRVATWAKAGWRQDITRTPGQQQVIGCGGGQCPECQGRLAVEDRLLTCLLTETEPTPGSGQSKRRCAMWGLGVARSLQHLESEQERQVRTRIHKYELKFRNKASKLWAPRTTGQAKTRPPCGKRGRRLGYSCSRQKDKKEREPRGTRRRNDLDHVGYYTQPLLWDFS